MKSISSLVSCLFLIFVFSCAKDDTTSIEESIETNAQIILDKTELTLEIGSTEQLIVSITPENLENKTLEWYSGDNTIATVDNHGIVKGMGLGSTNIIATLKCNGKSVGCKITVVEQTILPENIALDVTKSEIFVGDYLKLNPTITPDNSTDKSVTWASTYPNVATVDNDGTVVGISKGTTDITVTTTNGKTAKCSVTVDERSVEFSALNVNVIDDTTIEFSYSITTKGVDPTEVGVCYDQGQTPTIESTCVKLDATKTSLSGSINNLKPDNSYFIRAYVRDSSDIYYGSTSEFTMQGSIITDFKITEIYEDKIVCTTPTIQGVSLKFCYGLSPNPEITDNLAKVSKNNEVTTVSMTDLQKAKTYYFRAYTLKDGKPQYYENEGQASTLGVSGQKISGVLIRQEEVVKNVYGLIQISYDLPEGTYEVYSTTPYGPIRIYKEKPTTQLYYAYNDGGESQVYVSGGSGKLYIVTSNYAYLSLSCYLNFKNLETDTTYIFERASQ